MERHLDWKTDFRWNLAGSDSNSEGQDSALHADIRPKSVRKEAMTSTLIIRGEDGSPRFLQVR